MSLIPPSLEKRFEVLGVLGRGAMGVVLEVFDKTLNRRLALKLIQGAHRGAPVLLERFQREAKALAQVKFPGVLQVFDMGMADDQAYLLTEVLEGFSLDQLPPNKDPLEIMLQAAEAMEAVHEVGLLHRDIKPTNLFLTHTGRTILLDFGLVLDPDRTRITEEGQFVGSLAFMAPELLLGKSASPESDWYSWGASLYWLYEREYPTDTKTIGAIVKGKAPPKIEFHTLRSRGNRARVLRSLLDPDPVTRLTGLKAIKQAFLHPSVEASRAQVLKLGSQKSTDPAPPSSARNSLRGAKYLLASTAIALFLGVVALPWISQQRALRNTPEPVASTNLPRQISFSKMLQGLEELMLHSPGRLASSDPMTRMDAPDRHETIRHAHEWIRSGQTVSSRNEWNRLARLNSILSQRGAPDLFGPMLLVSPFRPQDLPLKPPPELFFRDLNPDVRQQLLKAYSFRQKASDVLDAKNEEIQAWYRKEKELPNFPKALQGLAILRTSGIRHLLEYRFAEADTRGEISPWLGEGPRFMRSYLLLSYKILGMDFPQRLQVTKFLRDKLDGMEAYWVTSVSAFSPELLVGGTGSTEDGVSPHPEQALFYAQINTRVGFARRLTKRAWRALEKTRAANLKPLLDKSYPPTLSSKEKKSLENLKHRALSESIEAMLNLGGARQAMDLFDAYQGILKAKKQSQFFSLIVTNLSPTWRAYPQSPQVRRQVSNILDLYDSNRDSFTKSRFERFREIIGILREEVASSARSG